MKKIILFDFDGTIANTPPVAFEITNKAIKDFGYEPITTEDFRSLQQMKPLEILTHFRFPLWKVPSLINRVKKELLVQINKVKLYPGIERLLLNLKMDQFKLAILSSNLKETVDKFLELHALLIFEYIRCEPNIFEKSKLIRKFLKSNNLKASEVVYIGDEVRDIEASRDNKVKVIAVSWGFNSAQTLAKAKPDYIAQKPAEIYEIVKNI